MALHLHCFSMDKRRSSRELVDESSGNASPSDSVSSIPSCMPFSWFGDRERSRDREREKEQSLSSCSLPHSPTEEDAEDGVERRNKVRNWIWLQDWLLQFYMSAKTPAIKKDPCTIT